MARREPDFSGWATRNDIKCSDGRTIRSGAFLENDGSTVPLVWMHQHNDVGNVLGHAELENRPDGVYAYGYFNDSPQSDHARHAVRNGDVTSLSIFANKLVQKGGDVLHGKIRELSLVLSGANPGAYIENVNMAHSDGDDFDEAIIYVGEENCLFHADDYSSEGEEPMSRTVEEVIDTLDDDQLEAVQMIVGQTAADVEEETLADVEEALAEAEEDEYYDDEDEEYYDDEDDDVYYEDDEDYDEAEHAGLYDGEYLAHEGYPMNVFEGGEGYEPEPVISHDDLYDIIEDAKAGNGSLRDAFLAHANAYGITNIDILFPDAQSTGSAAFIQRNQEWVSKVLAGVQKKPFSRIKSIAADLTADEARARGYIKGNQKADEVIKLLKRETTPTTIYKKQKLDRDDVIDITDFNVINFLKDEMRVMLNEEIARAILFGDGRNLDHKDKIKEDNIRPIAKDVAPYTTTITVAEAAEDKWEELIKSVLRAHKHYRGSGTPTLFIAKDAVVEMLLLEDKMGRTKYDDIEKLKLKLRVKDIVEVPNAIFKNLDKTFAIIVNLNDYVMGSDKQGETTMFEDFDIDFNQHKYLIETRLCGALIKPESALILKWGEASATKAAVEGND